MKGKTAAVLQLEISYFHAVLLSSEAVIAFFLVTSNFDWDSQDRQFFTNGTKSRMLLGTQWSLCVLQCPRCFLKLGRKGSSEGISCFVLRFITLVEILVLRGGTGSGKRNR